MYHTRQRVEGELGHDIQTDDSGLDSLTDTASSAIFSLSLGVSAVGKLLSHAEVVRLSDRNSGMTKIDPAVLP